MLKVNTDNGPVWINPAHVIWFWNWRGTCHVALTHRDEMFVLPNTTADEFAEMLSDAQQR